MKSEQPSELTGKLIRTIDTKAAPVFLRDDGIVVYHLRSGAVLDMDEAKRAIAAINELMGGRKGPFLVNGTVAFTMGPGVREYFAGAEALAHIGIIALLVGSTPMRIAANLYMTLNRPPVPTRLFNAEAEAVVWLRRMDALLARKPAR